MHHHTAADCEAERTDLYCSRDERLMSLSLIDLLVMSWQRECLKVLVRSKALVSEKMLKCRVGRVADRSAMLQCFEQVLPLTVAQSHWSKCNEHRSSEASLNMNTEGALEARVQGEILAGHFLAAAFDFHSGRRGYLCLRSTSNAVVLRRAKTGR